MNLDQLSVFSSDERKEYFKKKWRKDHISLLAVLGVISLLSILLPIVFDKIWLCGFAPIIFLLEYIWQNNRMMIYVEHAEAAQEKP